MPWPSYHFTVSQLHTLTWACLKICKLGTRYTSSLVVPEITGRGQLFLPSLRDYSPLSMATTEQSVDSLSVVMSAYYGHITHNWQAQTARYENAKKITVTGTCPLIQNPSAGMPFPVLSHSCLTSCLHLYSICLYNGSYQNYHLKRSVTWESNTNKAFPRNGFYLLILSTAIENASLGTYQFVEV